MRHLYPGTLYLALAATLPASLLPTAYAAEDQLSLEEIVVTAQKREQSLQDVPIAIQALGADILEQNSVTSISDIGNLTPGLSICNSIQDGAEIAIRGIGTAVLGLGFDQSVPLYLDGVYLGRGFDLIGDLMDIQQIEVLKGPQGTLFGRNAAAGAVNVTTQSPQEDFAGSIRAGIGEKNLRKLQGTLNIPINEQLALRANAAVRQRDGWQKNLDGGDPLYEQDHQSGRVKLLWSINDDTSVEFTTDYSKFDDTQGGYLLTQASSGIPTQDLDDKSAPSTTRLSDGSVVDPAVERTANGYAAKVLWDINEDLTLTAISSYRTFELDMFVGTGALTPDVLDLSPGPVFPFDNLSVLVDQIEMETDEYSQEFRLNGVTNNWDWFVGINFFKSEAEQIETFALPGIAVLTGPPLLGTYGDDRQGSKIDTESFGIFGDVIWHITDRLNASFGLRYSYDEKEVTYFRVPQRLNLLFATVPDDFANGITQDKADWDDVSGRIVLDYQLTEETMVFAGITMGYKSGGFGTTTGPTTAAAGGAFDPFDKETTTSFETGLKAKLLDNRMHLNASVFYTHFEDYQLQIADLTQPATALDLSAPEATSHGVDIEISFAMTERITLGLISGYLETEYAKDVEDNNGVVAIPEGQDLLRAPRWTTTATFDYTLPIDIGQIRFNATYTYRTSQRLTNSTTESLTSATITATGGDPGFSFSENDLESGSYGLLNARLSFMTADERWEIAAWGTNLTDKAYRDDDSLAVSNALLGAIGGFIGTPNSAFAVAPYTRNEPRMWGIDVTYNF
ncbi:TonB-dependent receptor [Maricurvus nonylphenolicus]|uniref:TonB-dependent receptor n=1 Tax=Maricurvus nonylphenolicus TaxID=1008307 RepID=UPI0036F266FC